MKTKLLFVGIIGLLLVTNITAHQSIAAKLANVEKGNYVPDSDPLVKRFNYLLPKIEKQYGESQTAIGDISAKSREIASEAGMKLSMLKLMEGAIQVSYDDYKQYCTDYVILFRKGYSNDNIINSLKKK
jgi:hypothetical protein